MIESDAAIRIYSETLATTFIDESTLSAVVPTDAVRPSGVYDVVVDQGSTTITQV